ncbi:MULTISPECIES: site-specific DNA-methyltransferase [Dickeya]|uniref:site-specific DNA-methyltransferase (adenine-specific) n=1 Tax=Dickeya aquatica TaxID=1401087 RepID=A0A375A6Q9_9GAMM|nr:MULTISPECIES: site-specific DNA-methyltransferase [Dickeya]SLM61744.1 Type III restriction-modification system methylation subunit [Dickeya aquatica]
MEKLKMHSPNLTQDNIARIRDLFPGCVTEAKGEDGTVKLAVDFDQLRQELADSIVEGPQERYHLNWPGKREALLTANAPIAKTLRPVREESVEFDTTKNLFIEGDNLEALKLLQETYLGKVKLIYVDPPYNTGSDFIYEDDFAENSEEYLLRSNQKDTHGNRLVANSESNGRFHSDWLSMIYPRLKLARSLLADDGVIFLSIDDNESANLKHILDEIFGEGNFIDTIAVEMSTTSGPKTVNAQQGTIVKNVEFVHVYRKSAAFDSTPHTPLLDGIDSYDTHYTAWLYEDGTLGSLAEQLIADKEVGADIRRFELVERGSFSIKNMDKLLAVSDSAKSFITKNLAKIARIDRAPVSAAGKSTQIGRWESFEVDHRTYFLTTLANGSLQALMPLSLNFRMSDDYKPRFGRTVIRGDLWKGFHQDMGNVAKEGGIAYANGKKPVRLIKQLIKWANNTRDAVVLDFFAGSATTAHAVMQANSEDGGNRRFILVQLDEVPDPKSEAAKEGYKSIAELSRARICKAGASIASSAEPSGQRADVGFRSLRVDTSNLADVYYTPDALDKAKLDLFVDNIKPDRTPEDLLFQVMLDWGVDLALPINKQSIQGKDVFFVDGNALAACFDASGSIDEAFVKELAKHQPLRVVFRDAGYKNSAIKINVEQIFKLLSPATEVKCI